MTTARTIVVDGETWRYRVGRAYAEARGDGRKIVACLHEIAGLPVEVFERGQQKRTRDGAVTPRQLAAWIRRSR